MAQNPQAHEVAGQLEDAQDTHEADDAQEAQHILGGLRGQAAQTHLQVEREDGYKVDDVERVLDELHLVGAEDHTHEELEGEPDHADALDVGEEGLRLRLPVVAHLSAVPHVLDLRLVHDGVEALVGLQAEGGDGDQDEEQGGKGHILWRRNTQCQRGGPSPNAERLGTSGPGPVWGQDGQDACRMPPSDMGQAGRPPFPLQSVEYGVRRPEGLKGCGGDSSVFRNAFPFFLDAWLDHNFPASPPGWVVSYDWSQAIRQCTKERACRPGLAYKTFLLNLSCPLFFPDCQSNAEA